jgi:hypothetical protein
MHKEIGLEIESDWLLDGYGIGSAPAAIGRHETVEAWVLEGAGWDRLARPAFPPAEGMGLRCGAFFDLRGAAASHSVCDGASWRVVMTIVLAALAMIS